MFRPRAVTIRLALKTFYIKDVLWAGIAQSVQRLGTGWKFRGSNPGERARFSAPVQTCPGAHPASYEMGTGSFPGVKRPQRGVDHPPLSSAEVQIWSYTTTPPSQASWPVLGRTLSLFLKILCSIFFIIKPTRYTNFTNLFCHETLHVSDSSSGHHQVFIHCTLRNGICHTGL